MLRLIRLAVISVAALFVLTVFALAGATYVVDQAAHGKVAGRADRLPQDAVALVLGTSENEPDGHPNLHFKNRIAAAADLFRSGRVHRLLLSGNGHHGEDEPTRMRRALLALGVPDAAMTLDNAGFRTLDSVIRAQRIFGVRNLVVVSDQFHVSRALFLARQFGIDAIAAPSRDVALRDSGRVRVREWFARVKACLDVWVLHTTPLFLGKPKPPAKPPLPSGA